MGEVGIRIDRPSVHSHFIMEVGAGGISRSAYGSQDLACLDSIPGFDMKIL